MISERTETLRVFDGTDVFFRCFTPKNKESSKSLKGLVLGIHGFGEHSGRYTDVAKAVCEKGLAFANFDLRGHGKSGPARGDVQNLHALILDVLFVVNHARSLLGFSRDPNSHFFGIFGHSFGGLLTTYAASILNDRCPPIFLSSPLYEIKQKLPKWKIAVATMMPRISPTLSIPIGIRSENISENPSNNSSYMADELNIFSTSTRLGQIVLEAVNEAHIRQAVTQIRAPVKIVCGALDKLTNSDAVKEVAPLFSAKGSSFHLIEDAGHEIFNEKETARAEAFSHLNTWLDAHLATFHSAQ